MQVILCDTWIANYLEHAGVWLGFLAMLKEVRKSDGGCHKISVQEEMLNTGCGDLWPVPLQGVDEGSLLEGLSKHSCVLSSSEFQASNLPWCSLALAELQSDGVG